MLYNFLKTSKKAFGVVFSVFVIFMLTSCENSFGHNSEGTENQNGKTYLSINVTKSGKERTITPTAIELSDLQNFSLKGTAEGESTPALNKSYNTYQDISENSEPEIAPGKWTFILSAEYSGSSDNPLPSSIEYLATVTTTIQNGKSNPIYFVLTPQVSGNGELEITFTKVNTSRKFDKIRATLTTITGSAVEIKEDFSIPETDNPNDGSITYSKSDLEPGTYHLLFEFLINKEQNNYQPAVNQWESYVYITPGVKTSATISLEKGFNKVYTIRYEDETGQEISDFSGFAIKKYSARSSFDLPKGKQTDKVFLGWKKYNSDGTYEYITKITNELNEDLVLVADLVDPVLYLSAESGDDTKSGFNTSNPIKTITKACELIETYGSPELNWKIKIDGDLKLNKATLPETITTDHAKSIELTGKNGLSSENVPNDKINQNKQSGTALSIKTEVPVTITNLGITGGRTTVGAGMFISQNSIVKLGDGVYIIDNNTGSGNGRGGGIHNEGTLFVYGTAAIGNPFATTWAVGDSSSAMFSYLPSEQTSSQYNGNYSGLGGGIYNGTGDSINTVVAKVYLGYSGYDADGITPIEETLTGGIYANGSSYGAGIYNQLNCEVYYKSGTIKYNTASATGGGIYNYGKVEMSGGEIVSNIAYFPWNSTFSGGGIYNGYSNYTRATCIISGGIINKNYATFGGGVYNAGNLYLYGSAVIGDKTATSVASATSNETCGNKAGEGAGIYNIDGTVYIGYDADGNIDTDYTDNGGIYYNLATNIYNTSNYYGGAIYNQGSNNNGLIKMASGTIAYNASDDLGGAVYLSSSKNFELSGGSIRNNEASNNGGAFCITNKESFSISGTPSIPKGSSNKNDILLKGTLSSICFDGPLNSSFEAYLNFSPYRRDSNLVLSMTKNVTSTTVADEYTKFIVAPYSVITQAGTTLSPKYVLTSDGYLVQGDVGGADAANYISNMSTSGTVIIGGKLTTGTITAIRTALQNLSTSKPDIRVYLDLSNASGFTESLGSSAFIDCTCLQEVKYIPTVTRIDASTFEGCSNLTTITIPVKIQEIRADAFSGTNLTTVNYMGTEAQKASKITKLQDTTIQNATWNYISYVFNITLDTGTSSDISVSVHDGDGNTLSSVSSIEKGTSLIFSTSSYSTYKWKVDGSVQSETSSLEINTSGWVVGATYNVSLIAADASGNEDSYFAQITVTE